MRRTPFMLRGRDLRDAVRLLWRAPHLSLGITLSVGIAMALTLAIVNIAAATSFRPIPGATDTGHLARVLLSQGFMPYPVYLHFRDHTGAFSDLVAQTLETETTTWRGSGLSDGRVEVTMASGNYFVGLGVVPAAGRFFREDDLAHGSPPVAVVSDRLWQREFDRRPDAIGAIATLDERPFTIIGVAPPVFTGVQLGAYTDVWIPITMAVTISGRSDWLTNPDGEGLVVIGRLQPASTHVSAEADLEVVAARFDRQFPSRNGPRGVVVRRASGVGPPVELPLLALLGALLVVGLLTIVVAGSNAVTLLALRAEERQTDTAVRLALGAGRGDIIRRHLAEACTLALAAGAVASVLVWMSGRLLSAWLPRELPVTIDFTPDARVLAIAFISALLLGLVLGVATAYRAAGAERTPLISAARTATAQASRSTRFLLFVQASAAMALLISASVLTRSIDSATRVDVGFPPANLHAISIGNGRTRDAQQRRQLLAEIEQRAAAHLGLTAATVAWFSPFSQASDSVRVSLGDGGSRMITDYNIVGSSYFEAMAIPIVRGRGFFASGDRGVIINEHLAARMFGGVDPVGQVLQFEPTNATADWVTFGALPVVGVARQAKYRAPWEPAQAHVYFPLGRAAPPSITLLVRTGTDNPERVLSSLVREVLAMDRQLTGVKTNTFAESIDSVFLWTRVIRVFFSIAALAALGIAAVGVYATTAYSMRRRTREIAIRVAVGATWRTVTWWLMRQNGVMIMSGALMGALAATGVALALTQIVVISVQASDPAAYAGAISVFAGAIGLAMYLSLRGISAVAPWAALRSE